MAIQLTITTNLRGPSCGTSGISSLADQRGTIPDGSPKVHEVEGERKVGLI